MALISETATLTQNAGKKDSFMEVPIRVLIVDDHPGVRAGIKNLLGAAKDIRIVGEGASGAEAIELVNTVESDILLLDIELPDQRGDSVMRHIHGTHPNMKVLAVSSYSDMEYILRMVENGVSGYLTKDEAPKMLLEAVKSIVRDGKNWFSPEAVKHSGLTPVEEQLLTEREVHILEQLLQDQSQVEIASALAMDEKQVKKYLSLLMKKFETESLEALKATAERIFSRR